MDNQCAVCKKENDQLLMLSCSHDPCIQCASQHYMKQIKMQSDFQLPRNFNNLYPCQICFQATKIDPSSIEQIKSYATSKNIERTSEKNKRRCKSNSHKIECIRSRLVMEHKTKRSSYKRIKSPHQSSTSSSRNIQLLNAYKTQQLKTQQLNNLLNSKSIEMRNEPTVCKQFFSPYFQEKVDFCEKHTDQIKTYYCFSCSSVICPECAIHGSHVGHEVQAIRKAGTKLKQIFNNSVLQAQRSSTILSGFIKQQNHNLLKFTQWNNYQKKSIKERFKQLHELLIQKQDKLIHELNEVEKKGTDKLGQEKESYERIMQTLKEKRKKLKDSINQQVNQWNFSDLKTKKEEISSITQNIKQNIIKKTDKVELVHLKSDIVEEAIDTIEQLVCTFRLSVRNPQLEGTATFQKIS